MPTKVLVADAAKSPSESEVMQALVVTVFYLFFSSLQIAIIRNIYVVIMDKDENNNWWYYCGLFRIETAWHGRRPRLFSLIVNRSKPEIETYERCKRMLI